ASLVPVAAFMAATPRTTRVPGWAGSLVVLGNLLWIAASLLLPAAGLISPNPLGWAFLAAQAGAVAILTWLEFGALRGQAAINSTGEPNHDQLCRRPSSRRQYGIGHPGLSAKNRRHPRALPRTLHHPRGREGDAGRRLSGRPDRNRLSRPSFRPRLVFFAGISGDPAPAHQKRPRGCLPD